MTLLRAANFKLSFGSRVLFDNLTFTIEEGERVGLVGVNGSGKSTLMKLLARVAMPDHGEHQIRRGARVTYLPQEPEFAEGATVASVLAVADGPLQDAINAHSEMGKRLETSTPAEEGKLLDQLSRLGDQVEQMGGWDTEHRAKTLLDRLGVKDWDRPIRELSGGLRKRVAVARALLTRPELLLLDEPTNHLDADTIEWLEEELDELEGALLLVTHDRYFLDDLVDRIVEINPGEGVTSYPGNYESYLEQKLVAHAEGEQKQHKRDRWISQEVAWLRRGPQARRTKSKARIDRARKLMAERGFTRPQVAGLQTVAAPRLGHTILEAKHVGMSFGERKILEDVSFILQSGERVGLVGPNGVGKTTFLRVMLGEIPPASGTVTLGKNTRVAYYDQQRTQLDPEQTVYDAASNGEDYVDLGGKQIALRDYLDDLLFPVPMQRMQVKALSGGERNRLLLARLFLLGANVLVLDEPTNDLDIVTLNVLEGLLLGFSGSVLLVTHDRYFLDKVATQILAFEGNGKVTQYPGNFDSYRTLKAQALRSAAKPGAGGKRGTPNPAAMAAPAAKAKAKLGYKDQRELDGMEGAINAAEYAKGQLEVALAAPDAGGRGAPWLAETNRKLEAAGAEVNRLYSRWEALQRLRDKE